MNLAEWHRHSFLNRLQSLLLIGFMAGFLALLGHLIWGPEGPLQLLFFAVILALLNPVAPSRGAAAAAVTELARRAKLPVPALYYVPSHMVNAFAVGSRREAAVAVTDGLLRTLTLREMVGVLAHELSHIRNNDLRVMGLADLMSRLTNMLSLLGQVLLFMNLLAPGVQVSWWAILLLILAPQLAVLAQLGLSPHPRIRRRSQRRRAHRRPGGLGERAGEDRAAAAPASGLIAARMGIARAFMAAHPPAHRGAGPPSARARASGGSMASRIASRVVAGGAGIGVAARPPASLSCERIVALTLDRDHERSTP